MKKLGLRAVAGGLALLLTASVFAPATPANAADVLLIAQAPKTLVITADMVDDDGEIVISNEKWDRIIIEKEAAAKDIYFDGVEVGELIVESGNSAKVQLWDVDAEQVTVKEPELDNLTLKDLATLLADKETRAETIEMYLAIRAKNESAKKTAPTIVTMEDAKVDKMVARANAALDLAAGEVGVVALEASSEVATARVTLRNYEGDVAFTGTEGKSNMILNNVNSTIESLKVEESAADNRLTVNSKGSVIEKAEIGGNAKVSLNIPMKSLEVTEEASAANVRVLNKVDEMEVAADSAKVEVTASGMVSDAVVTGDKVNIGGNGCLTNVEITGSDAYVSTEGTKVEGENNYVRPVYVEMPYDSWSEDFSDATLEAGVATDDASLNYAKYRYDAENGYGVVSTTAGWQGFAISLDNLDNGSPAYFVASVRVKKLGGISNGVRVTENGAWPDLGDRVDIGEEWVTVTTDRISVPAGSSRTIMIAPLDGSAGVTLEMAVDNVVVKRYTDWTEPPARPKPTENVTYTFDDLTLGTNYGVTTSIVNGSLNISYVEQYQEAQYNLPVGMFTDDYDKILIDFEECTGTICFKVFAGGKTLNAFYGNSGDCVLDLSPYGGYEVTHIGIMQDNPGQGTCEAVINSFTFVVASEDEGGEEGGESGGETVEPEKPAEPVEPSKLSDKWVVYDLADFTVGGYGYDVTEASFGGQKVALGANYQEIRYIFAEDVDLSKYDKLMITLATKSKDVADCVIFKLVDKAAETDDWDNPIPMETIYDVTTSNTEDYTIDLAKYAGKKLSWVTVSSKTNATEAIVYRIALLPKEGTSSDPTTTPEVVKDAVTITDPTSTELKVGESLTLVAKASGENTITWKSSDEAVATVADGKVTAKKAGEVTITATYGTATDDVKLTVVDFVDISATETTVIAGKTLQLTVVEKTGDITWKSSDDKIATVDETGLVTAVTGGAVKITATVGKASDTVDLTVKNPEAKFVTITAATNELYIDGTLQLSAVTNDGKGTITWESSDETVATVADGKVTAKKEGKVTITASCEGYDADTVELEVELHDSRIMTDKSVLKVDETATYTVTTEATNYTVKWSSSEPTVAEIDEATGEITALKAGKTIIMATSDKFAPIRLEVTVEDYLEVVGDTPVLVMTVGETKTFTVNGSADISVVSSDPEKVAVVDFDAVTGVVTVEAKAAGEVTITVKCGTAEDIVIEATAEAAAPAGPEDGTLCTPVDGFAVMVFGSEDLRTYAGKNVTISVSVCKRGDAEVAVHLQTTKTFAGVAGNNSWNQSITEEWITYKSDYLVPADWASVDEPVYFGLLMSRANEGQGDLLYDYDACDYYYKDFSVVENEVDESKVICLVEGAYDNAVVNDNQGRVTISTDCYLNNYPAGEGYDAGNGFVNIVAQNGIQDPEYLQKFTTLSGIMEAVEYFEFSVTLEQITKKEGGADYEPQAHILVQGEACEECIEPYGYCTCATYSTHYCSTGIPEGSPKTIVEKVYTDEFSEWNSSTLLKVAIEICGAQEGEPLVATYSINAVLK